MERLAPPGQSLAFSLGDEKCFGWLGAYDITAAELLIGTDTGKTESKTAQAEALILDLLANGKKCQVQSWKKRSFMSLLSLGISQEAKGSKVVIDTLKLPPHLAFFLLSQAFFSGEFSMPKTTNTAKNRYLPNF